MTGHGPMPLPVKAAVRPVAFYTAVLTWLDARNFRIRSASTRQTALEDIFLHLTGRSLRD